MDDICNPWYLSYVLLVSILRVIFLGSLKLRPLWWNSFSSTNRTFLCKILCFYWNIVEFLTLLLHSHLKKETALRFSVKYDTERSSNLFCFLACLWNVTSENSTVSRQMTDNRSSQHLVKVAACYWASVNSNVVAGLKLLRVLTISHSQAAYFLIRMLSDKANSTHVKTQQLHCVFGCAHIWSAQSGD